VNDYLSPLVGSTSVYTFYSYLTNFILCLLCPYRSTRHPMIKNISFVQSNGYEHTTSWLLMMDALSTESKKSWLRKCMQIIWPPRLCCRDKKVLTERTSPKHSSLLFSRILCLYSCMNEDELVE
jgi:hypothetical protein